MQAEDLTRFETIITPAGVRHRRRSAAQMVRDARRSMVKTVYLVWLALQQQSFGLSLGHLWLVLEPSLQAAAYFFLIRFVLGVRGEDMTFAFFFTGITFWRSHAVLVTSAPYFLATKAQVYIEQNMPLETAYLESLTQEIFLFLIRLLVLVVFLISAGQQPSLTWLFAIPIAFVMFTFSSSLAIWISVVGLYFKDTSKFVGHVIFLWWYMSPGLYTIRRIPDWFLPIYKLNPFAHIIPALHDCMLTGHVPGNGVALLIIFIASAATMVLGWKVVNITAYQIARYS